jgi:hypothetical protein
MQKVIFLIISTSKGKKRIAATLKTIVNIAAIAATQSL